MDAARDEHNSAWFMRVPVAVLLCPEILDTASATDWRVLLSICQHQGWKRGARYRKTFPLSIARTAEEARCSRRAALRSLSWWCQVGALRKTKVRRMNAYEVVSTFPPIPVNGAAPRHKTPKSQNRSTLGRYVPSAVTPKVPAHGTGMVPAHGTGQNAIARQPNREEGCQPTAQDEPSLKKSLSEVFNENPPISPQGDPNSPSAPSRGDGRSDASRPVFIISEDTIRELLKIKSQEEVIDMLRKGNYPIPASLLIDRSPG